MSEQIPLTPARLFESLAREMATAVAALVGETAATTGQTDVPAAAWTAHLVASGAMTGAVTVGVPEADGRRISALIMGFEGHDVPDEAVLDTLREICGQAIGAMSQQPDLMAVRLRIDRVARESASAADAHAWRFELPGGLAPVLVVTGALTAAPPPASVARPVTVPPPAAVAPPLASATAGNLDLLLDMELPLSVRFGQTELTLQMLTRLGPGSVIDLHRSADEPVEVLVSGKVVARGEVVVVEGSYGVRVTEVISTAERIRSLGA